MREPLFWRTAGTQLRHDNASAKVVCSAQPRKQWSLQSAIKQKEEDGEHRAGGRNDARHEFFSVSASRASQRPGVRGVNRFIEETRRRARVQEMRLFEDQNVSSRGEAPPPINLIHTHTHTHKQVQCDRQAGKQRIRRQEAGRHASLFYFCPTPTSNQRCWARWSRCETSWKQNPSLSPACLTYNISNSVLICNTHFIFIIYKRIYNPFELGEAMNSIWKCTFQGGRLIVLAIKDRNTRKIA